MLSRIRDFMRIDAADTEVNRARLEVLSRHVPLMYGLLIINLIVLSVSQLSSPAPSYMTIYLPVVAVIFMVTRIWSFSKLRIDRLSDAQVVRKLRQTVALVVPVSAILGVWGMLFLPYGDAGQNAQAIVFNAVSVTACAFCLAHLRQASFATLATVTPLTCGLLMLEAQLSYWGIALNFALVAILLGIILNGMERDFVRMIRQKVDQRAQHQRLQGLYEENMRLANTDDLTGLPNRRKYLSDIEDLANRSRKRSSSFVIALLDLDGFKAINDVFGHQAGDAVLVETSRRLKKVFEHEEVSIARLSVDEFGLIIRSPVDDESVMALAGMACEALRETFRFDEGTANLSATIGLARYPDTAETCGDLFDRADYALYYAKEHQKSEPVFFSHEHEKLVFAHSAMEQALRHADLEQEMSVEFQPVLDLEAGHSCGLEALARWYSPTLGHVRPDRFIKIAEITGIIGHLSEVLFRKAVCEARHWPEHLTLSFNLSAISLNMPGAVSRLLSIAEQQEFPVSRLVFEITESAVLKDFDSALEVLEEIKAAGARIAIDDFGTGYSSLAYVHRLPIDALKVDRSFVRDLPRNEKSANVLRSILNLCENMGLDCIVEGVETQEQFDLICDLGAGQIQGYYYSKPLSAGDAHMVLQIEFGMESSAMFQREAG